MTGFAVVHKDKLNLLPHNWKQKNGSTASKMSLMRHSVGSDFKS